MEICIFYSWQSKYRENCDKIIGKALNDAIKELNKEQDDYHYYIEPSLSFLPPAVLTTASARTCPVGKCTP